ncbi:type VI secretion system lipoprotein TssJ [Martelella alba]|uniref:Type VI secretion system lipoprotein TssJ n=1 Tax=Martelella alba TaxID=2590451 RepID=A0ABY2SH83_9HYPH|nr:type VI secretion system lipoprotein TssJ [Martelella alba]TKI03719.1 type VI secretion system lipoprotein TssJ [Martelella alba]
MAFVSLRQKLILALCCVMTGCGLTQTLTDGAISMTKANSCKKIRVLHLDFVPRAAFLASEVQTSSATMVWVYQVIERRRVDTADDQTLLRAADIVLGDDAVAAKSLLLMPNASATLDMPMDNKTRYVAIVGLFAGTGKNEHIGRLVLGCDELDPHMPRTIELGNGVLTLTPVKKRQT